MQDIGFEHDLFTFWDHKVHHHPSNVRLKDVELYFLTMLVCCL